ncbi:MAG: transcription antitermination protein NusB [Alphaproteobacteria bacterium]|nr:transcription antitermination protein NusB [Alphaproteobacteria bacterium]
MEQKNTTLKYTNARLLAVQALYTHAMTDEAWDKITSRCLMGEIGGQLIEDIAGRENYVELSAADAKLFTKIVQAVKERETDLDEAIKGALNETVQYDRLEITLKCILMAGMAEFYANPNLDAPIIINEYTDIAKSFYDGPEVKITNAVLDRFAKIVRE